MGIALSTIAGLVAAPSAWAVSFSLNNATLNKTTETHASITLVSNASAKDLNQAQSFVNAVTENGLSYLSDSTLTKEALRTHFKTILEKNFDLPKIARFSLGRYWRTASKAQQKEYTALFKNMIIDVYAHRFSEYQGQTLTVGAARAEGKRDIIVPSVLSGGGTPDIMVDWRVRKNGKGRFKVIDVIVEGVSMAMTQRSDFSSVIQRGGGDVQVLIAHLQK